MTDQDKPKYIKSSTLISLIESQESIEKKYNPNSYFGHCMRVIERQSADFMQEYINGDIIVNSTDFDLIEKYLKLLKKSSYSRIKHLYKDALSKYKQDVADYKSMVSTRRHTSQNTTHWSAPVIPTGTTPVTTPFVKPNNTANTFSILNNKKAMHALSSTEFLQLGTKLYAETGFSTTKLKNKFNSFVSYKIERILSGQEPADYDFENLVKQYALCKQKSRYIIWLDSQTKSIQQTDTVIDTNVTEKKPKKSTGGFFKKLGTKIKNAFNKVKKPLIITGIFALSIFGAKKAYDTTTTQDNQTQTEQSCVMASNDNSQTDKDSVDIQLPSQQKFAQSTQQTESMRKAIRVLNNLKNTNPSDKNMDVEQTAQNLYRQFGEDIYNIVLASAMKPYVLNNYMKFDCRPSTHNMLSHLSTQQLTKQQRAALNQFMQNQR